MSNTAIKTTVSSNNLKVLNALFNKYNKKYFDNRINGHVVYNDTRFRVDVSSVVFHDGRFEYRICIPEEDVLQNNLGAIAVNMLTQMVLIYGLMNNIKMSSNRQTYLNKKFNKKATEVGLTTKYIGENGRGFFPTGIDATNKKILKNFHLEDSAFYKLSGNPSKKSSTRKYICPCCGNSFRATKNLNVICGDCNEQFELAS